MLANDNTYKRPLRQNVEGETAPKNHGHCFPLVKRMTCKNDDLGYSFTKNVPAKTYDWCYRYRIPKSSFSEQRYVTDTPELQCSRRNAGVEHTNDAVCEKSPTSVTSDIVSTLNSTLQKLNTRLREAESKIESLSLLSTSKPLCYLKL